MELRADTAKGQFWNCSHCLAGLHFVISIPRKVSDLLRGDGGGRALAEMFFFSSDPVVSSFLVLSFWMQ